MEKKINRLEKEERVYVELTPLEVKRRLKHIAGLCYSLCCDISNMEIETKELKTQIKELKEELSMEKAKPKKRIMSPEQEEHHRAVMREYYNLHKEEINAKARAKTAKKRKEKLAETIKQ